MTKRAPTKKGDVVSRKRLVVDIPEPIFRALKVRSAQTYEEMREIVAEALRKHLGIKEGGEPDKR
jgi:hypothetical protein